MTPALSWRGPRLAVRTWRSAVSGDLEDHVRPLCASAYRSTRHHGGGGLAIAGNLHRCCSCSAASRCRDQPRDPEPVGSPRSRRLAQGAPSAQVKGQVDRGLRPAQAAQVVGPRRRALRDVLGLHRPGADDLRGLRARCSTSRLGGLRTGVVARVAGGHLRQHWCSRRHRRVRRHPRRPRPAPHRPEEPLLRQPHRRRVARAVHDHDGGRDAGDLPRRPDQRRPLPVHGPDPEVPRSSPTASRSCSGPAATTTGSRRRRSSRSSRWCSASWCWSSTPSTCTSSWRR